MMRKGVGLVLALSLAAAPVGVALAQAPAAPIPAPGAGFDVSDYRLAIQDKVKVTVYNEPNLSGEFLVNSDGAIAYPLVGNIPAQNKTAAELQKAIHEKLADGFIRNPSVAIEIVTFRPFYIYGEVNGPGEYPYTSGLTVLTAIALAKGFTYRANKNRIYLKRAGQASETEVRADLDMPVAPGDTIRVAERFF